MAGAAHLELLVEEPSMEAFLRQLLPRVLPQGRSFSVHPHQGKSDLLGKLEARLKSYANWLPADWRVIVIVDQDEDDCRVLKQRLEAISAHAGLETRARARSLGRLDWRLVNRIAVEELEAWYFGDWDAVRAAYPRVAAHAARHRALRDPDAVTGGTWEVFERIMQRHGYFKAGLPKIEVARAIGARMEPGRNRSRSFDVFHAAVMEAVG